MKEFSKFYSWEACGNAIRDDNGLSLNEDLVNLLLLGAGMFTSWLQWESLDFVCALPRSIFFLSCAVDFCTKVDFLT